MLESMHLDVNMSLSADLKDLNDLVNTLSIRSSRPSRNTHQSIYQLISNHLSVHTNFNPTEDDIILTKQLAQLSTELTKVPRVVNEYRRLNQVYREHQGDEPSKNVQDCHMYIAMLNHIHSIGDKLRWNLYGYRSSTTPIKTNIRNMEDLNFDTSSRGPTIHSSRYQRGLKTDQLDSVRFFAPIRTVTSTNLSSILEVTLLKNIEPLQMVSESQKTMIVKISREDCLLNEISIYEQLLDTDFDLPLVLLGFKYLGDPVILMERLISLDESPVQIDNILISIIGQLKILHEIGVHCDIKPSNILYSPRTQKYHLIDFGGVVSEQSKRFTYTRSFACQRSTSKEPSKKADLIELLYTINHIISQNDHHHRFDGVLKKIWMYVCKLSEITPSTYDQIIDLIR